MRHILIVIILILISLQSYAQGSGSFSGTVVNKNGDPIFDAVITLDPDKHTTKTNLQGNFSFRSIYIGEYTIQVSSPGYGFVSRKITVTDGAMQPIILEIDSITALEKVDVIRKKGNPDNLIDVKFSAMPVTIINRETIELMGSRRLDEVLKEQTGIAIVNNIAGGNRSVGIQMQGFSSEYIMILIDGQPMTGRNNGNFDLSRISVTNIERIEIIKGAASCLFGSEAMGGAINIITRHGAVQPQALTSIRYGSLNTVDATLEAETPFASKRGEANLFVNYYRLDGFNVDQQFLTRGTTVPPSDNFTIQGRTRYRLHENSTLGVTGRYAMRWSSMPRGYGHAGYTDRMKEPDLNLSAYLNNSYQNGLQSLTRVYFNQYNQDSQIKWDNGVLRDQINFQQTIYRIEQQFSYNRISNLQLTGGLGGVAEAMNNTDIGHIPSMKNGFVYAQGEWRLNPQFSIIGGGRYDYHNNYGGAFNPNIGLTYSPFEYLSFKTAVGKGFKTPDFRQRFQVFTNPIIGYTVIGSDVAPSQLIQMQNNGELSELRTYTFNKLQQDGLQAEKSNTFNMSAQITPNNQWSIELAGFYHYLTDQINSFQVATAIDGQMIYSYLNLPKVNNRGLEASVSFRPHHNVDISLGYQFLEAKDLSVKDSISKGNWPYYNIRNPKTGETFTSKPSDYWGMENRSRHMANFRFFYKYAPMDIGLTLRVNYRSKYPFEDNNGNFYIDRFDTFVDGFWLFNASVEKKLLKQHLAVQLIADNIMNYTDRNIPGQIGRVLLLGLTYRFFKP